MKLPLVIFGMLNEITTRKVMNDMLNIPNEYHTFRYITIDGFENQVSLKREKVLDVINDSAICPFPFGAEYTDAITLNYMKLYD